jgi:hypothetical protein
MRMSDHDPDDPMRYLNALEIALLAARLPQCPHCTVSTEMVPMGRSGWALGINHERGCPEHEDNQPADEVNITEWMNRRRAEDAARSKPEADPRGTDPNV